MTIRAQLVDAQLEITVADDGIGIDTHAIGGFGLANLHARAARLGGQLEVRTAAGQGTQVILRLPAATA